MQMKGYPSVWANALADNLVDSLAYALAFGQSLVSKEKLWLPGQGLQQSDQVNSFCCHYTVGAALKMTESQVKSHWHSIYILGQ